MKRPRKIRGSFCTAVLEPKSRFDKRSFRWKKSKRGRAWMLIGCPRGKWNAKTEQCTGGTRIHELMTRSSGSCPVGERRVRKG